MRPKPAVITMVSLTAFSTVGLQTTLALLATPVAVLAQEQPQPVGDVFDQFFRYTEKEHRAFFGEIPGETVDPFTGTLQIVRRDLVLPGKAGLNLEIVRSYSSKIWGRADLLTVEPLLAEKEHSVLGYGWSFHMGRLLNPFGCPLQCTYDDDGNIVSCVPGCINGTDLIVYQAPDGSSRVFYPFSGSATVFVSKDYWRLEKDCVVLGGAGVCVWSDKGVRYEFSNAFSNQFSIGSTAVLPVSGIVDQFGNRISVTYVSQTGAVDSITDTYDRTLSFHYTSDVDGLRLDTMNVNGNTYQYFYTTYTPSQTSGQACGSGCFGLSGPHRFLTEVLPPAGPPELYEYAYNVPVEHNQYALKAVTYPSGATTTYSYESVPFFTGGDIVPFSVVTHRTVSGRGIASGDWTYAYSSPPYMCSQTNSCATDPATGLPTNMHVTTISRPDGLQDTVTLYGLGWAADQNTSGFMYLVGLTYESARANRAEVETLWWDPRNDHFLSSATIYRSAVYTNITGGYFLWDFGVAAPALAHRVLYLDGATYITDYSDFDAYGQAQTVTETGHVAGIPQGPPDQVRTTTWTYFYAPVDGALPTPHTANIVRGRPLTQHVCIAGECVDSGWTYNGPGFARDTETVSGVTTTFGYDPFGNLATVTNALGQTLRLSGYVEGHGTPSSIDFNGAFNVSRTASWEGWILSETNGRGYTTNYAYDAIGRTTGVTPPGDNNATGYTYAPDGSWVNLARGDYSQLSQLDGLGRVVATSDSVGIQTSVRYDNMQRAWFKSYPYDSSIGEVGDRFVFDGLGRVVIQTKAFRPDSGVCDTPNACRVQTYYYANCIRTTVERAQDDLPVTWECNVSYGSPDEQRLTQVGDANGGVWQYTYSASGKLTTVTAPVVSGNRSYGYDEHQFLVSETSGEAGTFTYGRNAIGQITSRLDGRPITATYEYNDPLSRLRRVYYQSGTDDDVTRDYDNANNITHVQSQNGGTYDYLYDELNRVTQQTWTYGGRSYVTSYHYDPTGCLDRMTYPSGVTLAMTCDTANRVTSVSIFGGAAIVNNITYHPSGQAKAMTYGNGKTTTIAYDNRGRAKTMSSADVVDLSYGYDGIGNVLSLCRDPGNSDCQNAAAAPNWTRAMTYDVLDRLETSTAANQWGSALYAYDELGNRNFKSVGSFTTNYGYDEQTNRLMTATGGPAPLPSMTFTWDVASRLASSSDGTTYRYDGYGRRIQKADTSQTTVYHYDAAGRVLAETLPDETKLRDYIYLGNKLIAVDGCMEGVNSSGCTERQWYHTDTLGSVLARTDNSGAVVAQFDYQPWGEQWQVSGVQGDRQYNGRVYDPGTGFHDYGARMYWPEIGRFISVDSAGPTLPNPMSFNRYSYTFNNPYKYTDPDGRNPLIVVGLACAGAGFVGSAVASYLANGEVNWNAATQWAAKGFLIGVTAGLGATMLADSEAASATLATAANAGSAAAGAGTVAAGSDALVRMADAAYQGTTRIVAGYELAGTAGLSGSTYNVNAWGLYSTEKAQGLFALMKALKAEAAGAGASRISITGSAIINQGLMKGAEIAGRLGLEFTQVNETTILLQGAVQ